LVAKKRLDTDGGIVVASIEKERRFADGGIKTSNGIEIERTLTDGRVGVAFCVETECPGTNSGVLSAGSVGNQRCRTNSCITGAIRIAKEGAIADCRIAAAGGV
jgi:hypothetical protein